MKYLLKCKKGRERPIPGSPPQGTGSVLPQTPGMPGLTTAGHYRVYTSLVTRDT